MGNVPSSSLAWFGGGIATGGAVVGLAAWFIQKPQRFAFAYQHLSEDDWKPIWEMNPDKDGEVKDKDKEGEVNWAKFFEERPDLAGLRGATGGRYAIHHIRACGDQQPPPSAWHVHDAELQYVYVLRGEITFEYEGHGELTMGVGSCVLQPRGIRHRFVRRSDDLELLDINSPAKMGTWEVAAPR